MKTLIIIIHPNLADSLVNKRWAEELALYPEEFVLHDLYGAYPDGKPDIQKEQAMLLQYDKVIFQFPLYWFNCPPLFKTWMDEVLTHGWAYGRSGTYRMEGKKVALAISAGINEPDFSAAGRYRYPLSTLTAAFELTFKYIKADYQPFFAFYGAEHNGTTQRIEESAQDYVRFLRGGGSNT